MVHPRPWKPRWLPYRRKVLRRRSYYSNKKKSKQCPLEPMKHNLSPLQGFGAAQRSAGPQQALDG